MHLEVIIDSGGQRATCPRNGRRHCILLVEDEYIQAQHVSGIIEEMGCEVVGPVASVHEALQLISRKIFDAALLDIELSGQSTRPVAARLDEQGIPVAVVTGYRRRDVPKSLQKYSFLAKPYTEGELRDVVQHLLITEAGPAGVTTYAPEL
jgi:CheY-like chemotaxis protein